MESLCSSLSAHPASATFYSATSNEVYPVLELPSEIVFHIFNNVMPLSSSVFCRRLCKGIKELIDKNPTSIKVNLLFLEIRRLNTILTFNPRKECLCSECGGTLQKMPLQELKSQLRLAQKKYNEEYTEAKNSQSIDLEIFDLLRIYYFRKSEEDLKAAKEEAYAEYEGNHLACPQQVWRDTALLQILDAEIERDIKAAKKTAEDISTHLDANSEAKARIISAESHSSLAVDYEAQKKYVEMLDDETRVICYMYMLERALSDHDFKKAIEIATWCRVDITKYDSLSRNYAKALKTIVAKQAQVDLSGAKKIAEQIKEHDVDFYEESLSKIIEIEAKNNIEAALKTFRLMPRSDKEIETMCPKFRGSKRNYYSEAKFYIVKGLVSQKRFQAARNSAHGIWNGELHGRAYREITKADLNAAKTWVEDPKQKLTIHAKICVYSEIVKAEMKANFEEALKMVQVSSLSDDDKLIVFKAMYEELLNM